MSALYEIEAKAITGETQHLADYAGKALLIVNVASNCGFTPQYEALETLYRRNKDKGFAVLGFPCNQFGAQEPGDEQQIVNFCSLHYDVSFPMFAKIEVNGPGAHPLYRFLKQARPGLLGTQAIKWNFTKFLIDPAGKVLRRFAPVEKPERIAGKIAAVLPGA